MAGKGGDFKLDGYVDVAERIDRFYTAHPAGRILTDMVRVDGDMVVFKAAVYRDGEAEPAATGWAYEREGAGYVNKTSYIENCETSAIGRALANLNFKTKAEPRPSRQEMEKVQRMRQETDPPADEEQLAEIRQLMVADGIREDITERMRARLEAGFTCRQAADAIAYLRRMIQNAARSGVSGYAPAERTPGADDEPEDAQPSFVDEPPARRRNAMAEGR